LSPHSSGQMIQSRPQQSHCSTLRKTASDPGLRRSASEGLCARRPHPTGHATRTVLFPPQAFVEDDGHPEDEEPRTEIKTQPRERGESPQQEKHRQTSTSVAPMTSNNRSHLNCCLHSCGSAEASQTYCSRTPHHSPRPRRPARQGHRGWAHRQAVTGTGGRTRPAAAPTGLGWAVAPRVPPGHRRPPRPRAGA
jgi:hypothetical protein